MKRCPNCNTECDESKIYCHNCGSLLGEAESAPSPRIESPTPQTEQQTSQPKNQKKSILMPILLSVSLVVIIILGIGLGITISDKEYYYEKYWNKNEDYYDLLNDYRDIEGSYKFYTDHARILPNDGSNIYHKYGCSKLDTSSFWIYNNELAITKASPCSSCCPND